MLCQKVPCGGVALWGEAQWKEHVSKAKAKKERMGKTRIKKERMGKARRHKEFVSKAKARKAKTCKAKTGQPTKSTNTGVSTKNQRCQMMIM